MTAPGEDVLAWMEHAITEREQVAQAAAALQDDPENGWGIVDDSSYAVPSKQRAISPHIGFTHEPESAEHIVLNNPAKVLRRCAADRKLLKLHAGNMHSCPATDETDYLDEWTHFGYEDLCPVVRGLAEGYGWTEGDR